RPVAKRHRRRHAALARMDPAAVLGGEQAQVEKIDLDPGLLQLLADEPGEAKCLRDLARAGAVVARRAADDERARPGLGVGPRFLRLREARLGFDPFDREVVFWVGIAAPGLPRDRRLAAV